MGFLSALFDQNAKIIKGCEKTVAKINSYEPEFEKLKNEEMALKTQEFRDRLEKGETLDDILPEAFALVRESAKRVLGMRHYDVQMIGGIILHQGKISEMKTGEGKTLVATLPLYLNALTGKGAHLVTVNDYLSKRDARWNGPVFHLLGLSIGSIHGQSAETGDIGRSYIYDPEYIVDHETPTEWNGLRPCTRQEAYACDITYGTNHEFGFDYLRDNMCFSKDQLTQRELNYAIVDEVDSILIDEARTPLIISGRGSRSSEMYNKADQWVRQLVIEKDYTVDEKLKTAMLTESGTKHVEELTGCGNLHAAENTDLNFYITSSLKAHANFKRDKDYVVKDNQVIIVDEFTGRLMYGRRWSEGLHQAIEAKEHVKIAEESQTLATVTYQNFFRLYNKLAGMTGTALTEEEEFKKIYSLDVVEIPTNKPVMRKDQADVVYKTEEGKFRGIALEVLKAHIRQQPVLVGTRSISVSERIADLLTSERLLVLCTGEILRVVSDNSKNISKEDKDAILQTVNMPLEDLNIHKFTKALKVLGLETNPMADSNIDILLKILNAKDKTRDALKYALKNGIARNVLNAKFHEKEADIIAEAGKRGAVTIATNMAGRGVDIILGGKNAEKTDPESDTNITDQLDVFVPVSEDDTDWDFRTWKQNNKEKWDKMKDVQRDVYLRGGLQIIGTERHESRRIDNQLRGRSGRQGDPGRSTFFVSFEDELIRLFGDKANHPLLQSWDPGLPINVKILSGVIEKAQKKVEYHHFDQRKTVLQYDDVMNKQRNTIYGERRRIIEGVDLRQTVIGHLYATIDNALHTYCPDSLQKKEWSFDELYNFVCELFSTKLDSQNYLFEELITADDFRKLEKPDLKDRLYEMVDISYAAKEKQLSEPLMREMERYVALKTINDCWIDHLSAMDFLREGIGLRGYAQKDPILEYSKEAFDLYDQMMSMIQDQIARTMYRLQPVPQDQLVHRQNYRDLKENTSENGEDAPKQQTVKRQGPKVGRNDPCPCGSGLKYKKCCGK